MKNTKGDTTTLYIIRALWILSALAWLIIHDTIYAFIPALVFAMLFIPDVMLVYLGYRKIPIRTDMFTVLGTIGGLMILEMAVLVIK